ncbi:MAG: DPP IV N-terminal domain-containing protein [Acidobacteriota bacterium]
MTRLAPFGYQPSWSPDGNEIACSTENYARPESRFVLRSQIHLTDVTTGQTRPLTPPGHDAIEPKWSPHGQRIAYWGVEGGRRDLWTIPAAGGAPVRVTNDAQVDWNPVWSPDGNYLYFSSDRGGSMNVWRVRIDEQSGKTLRNPEPVTMPSPYSGHISFSQDGRRMAYVQLVRTSNLHQVGFDAQAGRVLGRPAPLTRGLGEAVRPDVTRDGRWLAFNSWGKEDIFVGRADGSGIRQITDDPHRDLNPRWSPDGRRLAFISNRSGHFEIWTLNPNGTGLRQLTHLFGSNVYSAAWAPDGARFACSFNGGAATYIVEADSPQRPEAIEALKEPPELFVANDWSRDGKKLAGFQMDRGDPDRQGVAVYWFDSGAVKRVAEFGIFPRWLSDSRRLVFSHRDRIYIADVESGKVRELASVSPDEIEWAVGVSGDDRVIYFTLISTEADIWLADFGPR